MRDMATRDNGVTWCHHGVVCYGTFAQRFACMHAKRVVWGAARFGVRRAPYAQSKVTVASNGRLRPARRHQVQHGSGGRVTTPREHRHLHHHPHEPYRRGLLRVSAGAWPWANNSSDARQHDHPAHPHSAVFVGLLGAAATGTVCQQAAVRGQGVLRSRCAGASPHRMRCSTCRRSITSTCSSSAAGRGAAV